MPLKVLALSTSSAGSSVALVVGAEVVARESLASDRLQAERIFAAIDAVLAAGGVAKRSLELVVCDLGPGSFTGVRVGVASAKGIALGFALPIVGVGALESMSVAAGVEVPVLAVLDARRDERFVAAMGRDGLLLAPRHVRNAALPAVFAELGPEARFVGDAGGALDEDRRIRGVGCDVPDAGVIGLLGAQRFTARGADELAALEPVYVRAPDAALPAVPPDYRLAPR